MAEEALKLCGHCHKERYVSQFYRRSRSPDGLQYCCKVCHDAMDKRDKPRLTERSKRRLEKYFSQL